MESKESSSQSLWSIAQKTRLSKDSLSAILIAILCSLIPDAFTYLMYVSLVSFYGISKDIGFKTLDSRSKIKTLDKFHKMIF